MLNNVVDFRTYHCSYTVGSRGQCSMVGICRVNSSIATGQKTHINIMTLTKERGNVSFIPTQNYGRKGNRLSKFPPRTIVQEKKPPKSFISWSIQRYLHSLISSLLHSLYVVIRISECHIFEFSWLLFLPWDFYNPCSPQNVFSFYLWSQKQLFQLSIYQLNFCLFLEDFKTGEQ